MHFPQVIHYVILICHLNCRYNLLLYIFYIFLTPYSLCSLASESSRKRKFHTLNFRSRERIVLGAISPVPIIMMMMMMMTFMRRIKKFSAVLLCGRLRGQAVVHARCRRLSAVRSVFSETHLIDQGLLLNYSDVGFFTISFTARCMSHRATGLGACPKGTPVGGVTTTSTPVLWPITFCSDRYLRLPRPIPPGFRRYNCH